MRTPTCCLGLLLLVALSGCLPDQAPPFPELAGRWYGEALERNAKPGAVPCVDAYVQFKKDGFHVTGMFPATANRVMPSSYEKRGPDVVLKSAVLTTRARYAAYIRVGGDRMWVTDVEVNREDLTTAMVQQVAAGRAMTQAQAIDLTQRTLRRDVERAFDLKRCA
ncbi:MAG: hypothetical protein ACKVP7_09145 [Hyphomicrobiaceae bacterium]